MAQYKRHESMGPPKIDLPYAIVCRKFIISGEPIIIKFHDRLSFLVDLSPPSMLLAVADICPVLKLQLAFIERSRSDMRLSSIPSAIFFNRRIS